MRKLYALFLFILCTAFANAQNPDAFITTWEVTEGDLEITIPVAPNPANNYTIDFGDGTILENQTGAVSHTYNNPGIYTVTMSGVFKHIRFLTTVSSHEIKTVEQWGTNQWGSMFRAFYGCSNLTINATDTPDLSQVSDMAWMFRGATSFNQPIDNWDVSNVTNMEALFYEATSFNQPLNNWDVSSVTNMKEMFKGATSFNQPLNNWNVESATNMQEIFSGASTFNGAVNNWNMSNVINMRGMFKQATSFNQPIDDWNVESVTTMEDLFYSASSFNQPLNSWNVSNVTNMKQMFAQATVFNKTLNDWDVSNVTNMQWMFGSAIAFNGTINNWNVSNVTNMKLMFDNTSFNQPLDNWDVSNVTTMEQMFGWTTSFNQPIGNWDVSNVTNMRTMFYLAESFNQPLDDWDVSNVTMMFGMFGDAASFNQPLNSWDVSSAIDTASMFNNAASFNQPLNNWDVSNIIDMAGMFREATAFNQDLSDWNFNSDVILSVSTPGVTGFLANSGLDIDNYDALLLKFVQLGIENKVLGATGLNYCNTGVRNYLISELGWSIIGDSLSGNCEYDNSITGNIFYDENNNGCDNTDVPVTNMLVNAQNTSSIYSTSADDEGAYILNVYEGTYSLGLLNIPNYFSVSPANSTVTLTSSNNNDAVDFCLTATQSIQDLNITLLPVTEARPGFEAGYQLAIQNIGTHTVTNASVTLTFDEAMQVFVSANPAPASTTSNQVIFDIASLQPFESQMIDLTMETFVPPVVIGGDVLNFTATVTPDTNDFTPEDNTFELAQIVVNSFDPNDKQVLQGEEIYVEQADEYLHYLVRFQNTGTASAINVRIEDVLDETLDWNTIQLISSSHDYRVVITEGNEMEFIFENINLPHEAANEAGSHGFIAYKIKPLANTQVGDIIIGNEANIYFDYNLPIVTNSVATEVVSPTAGISTFSLDELVSVYPNPADAVLNISVKGNLAIEDIKIYNLQGRELLAFGKNMETITIADLSSGVYLLNIKTSEGTISKKIIKK